MSALIGAQVRLPRKFMEGIRLLAVKDLFECVDLCVCHGEGPFIEALLHMRGINCLLVINLVSVSLIGSCSHLSAVGQVERPTGRIPGLAVANALCHTSAPCGAFIQPVEVFLYPGNGQLIITATTVSTTRQSHLES